MIRFYEQDAADLLRWMRRSKYRGVLKRARREYRMTNQQRDNSRRWEAYYVHLFHFEYNMTLYGIQLTLHGPDPAYLANFRRNMELALLKMKEERLRIGRYLP
jgi:hypothetical protein